MNACAPITPKQAAALDFLRACPTCPSYREMQIGLGLSSTSGVHRLIESLEARGFVRRLGRGNVRAIEVIEQNPLESVSIRDLIAEVERRGYRVAVCGECQAVPGSERAHSCTDSNCGLADRFHGGAA